MLNLEFQVSEIIENDERVREQIDNRYISMLKDDTYPYRVHHTPEWYEEMDYAPLFNDDGSMYPDYSNLSSINWHVYADALREFGVVMFTQDLMTGKCHTEWTRQLVKMLVEQYGLRNVTNEFSKQIVKRLNL